MNRNFKTFFSLGALALLLTSCATDTPTTASDAHYVAATNVDKTPVKVVKQYVAVPLEKQGMHFDPKAMAKDAKKSKELSNIPAVNAANKKSMRYPTTGTFVNSVMNYNFMEGAMYVVYTAPGQITDIQFADAEQINSYAAGDTLRWKIAKTFSGSIRVLQHLLIKPTASYLSTTLVVMTNQRVYHLLLKSTNSAFMAAVRWQYPNAMLTSYSAQPPSSDDTRASSSSLANVDISKMNTHYSVTVQTGDASEWKPIMVFDDGAKTYIHFPASMEHTNAPVLMVDSGNKHYASTINYRMQNDFMIIDAMFDHARLVMGDDHDKNRSVVQINREK